MHLKTRSRPTDPRHAQTPANFRNIPTTSRRKLLVRTSQLAGAALLLGSCLRPATLRPRSLDPFWSDGTDWVE